MSKVLRKARKYCNLLGLTGKSEPEARPRMITLFDHFVHDDGHGRFTG